MVKEQNQWKNKYGDQVNLHLSMDGFAELSICGREHKEGESWQFTADNPEFVSLASLYASRHSTMSQVGMEASYQMQGIKEAGITIQTGSYSSWKYREGTKPVLCRTPRGVSTMSSLKTASPTGLSGRQGGRESQATRSR